VPTASITIGYGCGSLSLHSRELQSSNLKIWLAEASVHMLRSVRRGQDTFMLIQNM